MKNKKEIKMKNTSFDLKIFNFFSLSRNSFKCKEYTKETSHVLDACHGNDKTEKCQVNVFDVINCVAVICDFILNLIKLIISFFQCNYYGENIEFCIL